MMKRRGFFGALLGAVPAPLALTGASRAEAEFPAVTKFVPPDYTVPVWDSYVSMATAYSPASTEAFTASFTKCAWCGRKQFDAFGNCEGCGAPH